MMKSLVLAATTISLAVSPVAAQTSAAVAAPQPAIEQVEGSELRAPGAGIGLALVAIIFILGALLATETFPFDDDEGRFPVSP